MRTFSILIGSAMLVAAFGSALMAEERTDCAGHYDLKAGTSFGRCSTTLEPTGFQGPGSASGAGGATSGGGGNSGSATGGNR